LGNHKSHGEIKLSLLKHLLLHLHTFSCFFCSSSSSMLSHLAFIGFLTLSWLRTIKRHNRHEWKKIKLKKKSAIEKRTKLLPSLSATFNFPFFPFYELLEKTFECQNLIYFTCPDGLNDLKKAARLISSLLPRLISGSPFNGRLQSAFVSISAYVEVSVSGF